MKNIFFALSALVFVAACTKKTAEKSSHISASNAAPATPVVTFSTNAASPVLSKAAGQNLKKKLLVAEAQVAQLQAEQTTLHAQLSQTLPPADFAAAAKRLKLIDAQLAQAEEEWMALGEALEA